MAQIGPKHKGEKFLITTSAEANTGPISTLFSDAGLDFTVSVLVKSVMQDLSGINLADYGVLVMYNPCDLKSLYASFPDFQQGDLAIISYGKGIAAALKKEGLKVAVEGPSEEIQSAAKAIDVFFANRWARNGSHFVQDGATVRQDGHRRPYGQRQMESDPPSKVLLSDGQWVGSEPPDGIGA